jgi:hypothetical protein
MKDQADKNKDTNYIIIQLVKLRFNPKMFVEHPPCA